MNDPFAITPDRDKVYKTGCEMQLQHLATMFSDCKRLPLLRILIDENSEDSFIYAAVASLLPGEEMGRPLPDTDKWAKVYQRIGLILEELPFLDPIFKSKTSFGI